MIIFIILGFVSSILQLTLLREFTFSIAKNELSFVASIGIWLFTCSLGSLTRAKKHLISDLGLSVLFGLAFCLSLFFTHTIKSLLGFPYFEIIGLALTLLCAVVAMGPVGFLTGYAFAQFSDNALKNPKNQKKSSAYFFALEALGVFAGGIIFTALFTRSNNPLSACALTLFFIPALKAAPKQKFIFACLLMFLSSIFANAYPAILKSEFQGANILKNQGTPYGPLIVTEQNNTKSLYLNGSLAATSEDKETDEAFIHTIYSVKKNIKNVLWIGPCFSSQIEEIKKYPQATLTCVDISPRPNDLPSFYPVLDKILNETQDPRSFLQKNSHKYDLIIMNIAAPSSLARNRFFSLEFFNQIKNHLTPDGIFAFSIPSKREILSPSIKKFNSCILNTLRETFPYSFTIPSDTMIILNSSTQIQRSDIIKNFKDAQVPTRFFTRSHLTDALDAQKQAYLETAIDKMIPLNTDLRPYGFVYCLLMEQAKFYPGISIDLKPLRSSVLTGCVFIIALLGFLIPRKKSVFVLTNTAILGFLSIGSSAIIYLAFQFTSGALFWKLGLLVGILMIGLSIGNLLLANTAKKITITTRHFAWLFVLWFIFCLETLFWIHYEIPGILMEIVWYVMALECGILTGLGYPLAIHLWQADAPNNDPQKTSLIYATDLGGAFLGTILFSLLLIPLLGISISFLILCGVIIVLGFRNFL